MLGESNIVSILNSKKINRIFLIYNIFLLVPLLCEIAIPFKYIEDDSQSINTPKEIMSYYMNQKINIKLEIGTPKQEIEIPLGFSSSDFYIVDKTHLRTNTIKNKLFDNKKSSSFKIVDESNVEYYFNDDYSTYQDGYDTLYFLKQYGKSEYSNIKMDFRFAYLTSTDDPGRFGLQIYSTDEDDKKVPCPLRMLYNNKINNNYVWSIHFNKRGNILGDEGYIIIGEYPHDFKKTIGIYDTYNFNKENFISEDLLSDIVIPQVTLSYVVHFDFNFGGILIPQYFNTYIQTVVFDPYIKEGKCFIETTFYGFNMNFYYCKKENSVINKIKNKIPTVIFSQDHLRYNFTININDLIYEKNDYVFFLLFTSGNQKNKWTLGKPFLQKYPLVFNPEAKDIGFYSSFLLTGIKTGIVVIIAIAISLVFIAVGLLIGRKKYRQYKIKKQQAMELSNNSTFMSNYKSIELNGDEENKLYKD